MWINVELYLHISNKNVRNLYCKLHLKNKKTIRGQVENPLEALVLIKLLHTWDYYNEII